MTEIDATDIEPGVRNLLFNCAGLRERDSLLVVYEKPELGWWQADLIESVIEQARKFGIDAHPLETGAPTNQRDEKVQAAMQEHDCSLFFARAGDQDRFSTANAGNKIVMCYARDKSMLASSFGQVDYQAMKALKIALDGIIAGAGSIEISCPLGTRLNAEFDSAATPAPGDVTVRRFPMGIVSPVLAEPFSGEAIISNYLTPTGAGVYQPANLKVGAPVSARIERGRISRFDGPPRLVESIEQHYQRVARLFDLEPFVIHSWHAGIHPGATCSISEDQNPDLWGNTVFNHPRYLHFHSCGVNAPGEISWMLRDHRVKIDGQPLWDAGRMRLQDFPQARQCLESWPELKKLYQVED